MAIAFARVGDYKNLRAPIENMEKEKGTNDGTRQSQYCR